jgi:hypothetical protein
LIVPSYLYSTSLLISAQEMKEAIGKLQDVADGNDGILNVGIST